MNFPPDFHMSKAFRKFKKECGQENALEIVHELFGRFQSLKGEPLSIEDDDDIDYLFDPRVVDDPRKAFDAAVESRLLVKAGESRFRSPVWEKDNAGLIARWTNGKKGGRPKGKPVKGMTSEANATDGTRTEGDQGNLTERNGMNSLNVIEGKEGNEVKERAGSGSVKPKANQEKPTGYSESRYAGTEETSIAPFPNEPSPSGPHKYEDDCEDSF